VIGGSLARRYARALLAIGQESGETRRLLSFERMTAGEPFLRELLESAHVNRRDKKAALEPSLSSAGFLPATRNFLFLLIDKGRMNMLPAIVSELRRMIERIEGIERVELEVPMPLTDGQRERLASVLGGKTGKKIVLEERIDPAVLGGMVVKIGSVVYDGSARTQIQKIRQNLTKG
jgi:F-type H+-transporting ATPase subunit delta